MVRGILAATVAGVVSACAQGGPSPVVMDEYTYEPNRIVVPADTPGYELTLENAGTLPHDFSVEGLPVDTPVHLAVLPGGRAPYPLPGLPAGEYTIYCGIEDHRALGMTATLEVRP